MGKYVSTMIAYGTALLILTYLSYALPKLLPGDFVTAQYSSAQVILTEHQEAELRAFYSDNEDFRTYLFRVMALDLGYSYVTGFLIGVETVWRKGSRFEKKTIGILTLFEGFSEIATGVILLAVLCHMIPGIFHLPLLPPQHLNIL